MTRKRVPPFPAEARGRAVRMVFEQGREHATQRAAICSVAGKIGCSGETPRGWVRKSERGQGPRPGATAAEGDRVKALEREVRELRQANEILREASPYL